MMSHGGALYPASVFQGLHHSPEVWPHFWWSSISGNGFFGGMGDVERNSSVRAKAVT